MVVFGGVVGFAVGEGVVDVRVSPISPIVINAVNKISDVLIGGVEFGVVVVDVGGVVVCCGCGCCCCWVVVCFCCPIYITNIFHY